MAEIVLGVPVVGREVWVRRDDVRVPRLMMRLMEHRADCEDRRKYPQKKRAWHAIWRAVLSGRIVPPSNCSSCGVYVLKIESHHEDYSKPLIVKWLCKKCHAKIHRIQL